MKRMVFVLTMVAILGTVGTSVSAEVIFSEDFNEAANTQLDGLAPEVGGTWDQTEGAAADAMINGSGEVDFSDKKAQVYGAFTKALAAGETLELRVDTNTPDFDMFTDWSGISLMQNGVEKVFFGDNSNSTNDGWCMRKLAWQETGDTDPDKEILFTYEYDTGDYQFSLDGGLTFAKTGTAAAGVAFDELRLGTGWCGLAVDSITITATAVPEPGTAALLIAGLLGLGGFIAQRKK